MATPTQAPTTATVTTTAIAPATTTTASTTTIKPGYKTSEFWLTVVAQVLSMLYASGAIGDGSTFARVAGLAASALTAAGYAVARGNAKSGS